MKWASYIPLLFLALTANAVNLTGSYCNDGGDKVPQQWFYPHGVSTSSSVINGGGIWDGTTCSPFSGRGETRRFHVVVFDSSSVDATNVTAAMSSMTCQNNTGITSVVVSSVNVMDTSQRPIQVFSVWYSSVTGISDQQYGHSEFEERSYPLDFRVPYTVSGGAGTPNPTTDFWVNRPGHDLFWPVFAVPEEEYLISSQTVKAGQSQEWVTDVYVAPAVATGTCTGTFSVYEGAVLSTSIPVNWTVYNFTAPNQPSLLEMVCAGDPDVDFNINGASSPNTTNGAPVTPMVGNSLLANQKVSHMARICDAPDSFSNYFPSTLGVTELNGTLFTSGNGYGGPGLNIGQPFYMIGTYGAWKNNFSSTNPALFGIALSSWAANINALNPTANVGIYGQDEVNNQTQNQQWACWVETNTVWTTATHVHMFVTGNLPTLALRAPCIAYPTTHNFSGSNVEIIVAGMSATPTCDYTDSNGVQYRFGSSFLTGSAPNVTGSLEVFPLLSNNTPINPPVPGALAEVANTCNGVNPCPAGCTGDATISYSNFQAQSSTQVWQNDYNSFALSGSSMVGVYNDGNVGWGGLTPPEEEGYVAEANYWGIAKKICPFGVCHGYHFLWEGTYWTDINQPTSGPRMNGESNLYGEVRNFGYSVTYTSFTVSGMSSIPTCDYLDGNGIAYQKIYTGLLTGNAPNIGGAMFVLNDTGTTPTPPAAPGTLTKAAGCSGGDTTISYSSWTQTIVHPQWGRNGFNYSQHEGLVMVPGTDTVYKAPSFGFIGPIALIQMKAMRDGIEDVDYWNAAYKANPSSATALMQSMFPGALWEVPCETPNNDCSYYLGDRTWAYTGNAWTSARKRLLMIAASGNATATSFTKLQGAVFKNAVFHN